jgi:pimeloyl-ACP methyl ester carboxylesterase
MISVLKQSRSGRGFLNDLTYSVCDVSKIKVPTLIIHSKYDASVDVSHPEYLAEHIQNAKLFMSDAENHMIWYSDYYPDIEAEMAKFLGQAAPEQ